MEIQRRILLLLTALIFVMVWAGCGWDPDRDNPADPGSYNWENRSSVQLHIENMGNDPLQGVRIFADDGNEFLDSIAGHTGTDGLATMSLPLGDITLRCELDGYAPVLHTVNVKYTDNSLVTIKMNGYPTFDSTSFTTQMQFLSNNYYTFSYLVHCGVEDPDGTGIDSVLFYEPDDIIRVLEYSASAETWSYASPQSEFLDVTLRNWVGQYFRIVAYDENGDSSVTTTQFKSFFFYDELESDIPPGQIVFAENPIINWDEANVQFSPLHYVFRLYAGGSLLIGPVDVGSETDIQLDTPLTPQTLYFWRLELIDPHGNWVRTHDLQLIPVSPPGS